MSGTVCRARCVGRGVSGAAAGHLIAVDVSVRRIRDEVDREADRGDGDGGGGGGTRVLVDRLWPRGLAKHDAPHDTWEKTVAPSTELRRWFSHDPDRFEEFGRRYRAELTESSEAADALQRLRRRAAAGPLVLLTATRDVDSSHARVLADVLTRR